MSRKVTGLEYSWKTFLSAQKVLSTLTASKKVLTADYPAVLNSELTPVPVLSKSPVPHHGGLLNNLNDPSKFPKRDYSCKPRKCTARPQAAVAVEDLPACEDLSPLICRSLSRPGTHFFAAEAKQRSSCSASRVELNKDSHNQSTGELAVILKKLALNRRIPQLKRRPSRPSTSFLRSRDKSFVSKGLDTSDPDHISASPVHIRSEKENKALQISYRLDSLPSTAPTSKNKSKRTLISKYLDHMLKEQAHKRTVVARQRAGSKAGLVRGSNKHSDAFRALTGLDTWEEFEEVLVGEKAAVARMTSGRSGKDGAN